MSSGSWKVLKVGAPGHGSYSLTKVKYIILKVVICIFGLTKVNYISFLKKKHGYICWKLCFKRGEGNIMEILKKMYVGNLQKP